LSLFIILYCSTAFLSEDAPRVTRVRLVRSTLPQSGRRSRTDLSDPC
jgi:hypothetical protein